MVNGGWRRGRGKWLTYRIYRGGGIIVVMASRRRKYSYVAYQCVMWRTTRAFS